MNSNHLAFANISDLALKKEVYLFRTLALISSLVWVGLISFAITSNSSAIWLVTSGALGICFIVVFATGMLAASLKSESVEISAQQLPQLHQELVDACRRLGLKSIPRLFVMQSNGMLNAFAMRHARRHFVVLFSDFVEAFPVGSAELRFILGHELGHISRKHVSKHVFLWPSMFIPMLGFAYRRACESTCDRFGALISGDADASTRAMLALAGGRTLCHNLSAKAFAKQLEGNRGFFVSLHELLSSYPTLSKRVSDLIAFHFNTPPVNVERNVLSCLFSMLIPCVGWGGLIAAYFAFFFGYTIYNRQEVQSQPVQEAPIEEQSISGAEY
ncbi:MAG: M48 family metallopeptidase [Myxococcota bacterium]